VLVLVCPPWVPLRRRHGLSSFPVRPRRHP
jgi:hypothetical protein